MSRGRGLKIALRRTPVECFPFGSIRAGSYFTVHQEDVAMPKPRKQLISLEATPYYHCVSRRVRRAFLCGTDSEGRCFEHRRGWIEKLILDQAQVFCIDIAAYAVMSNHFHVVLHVSQQRARSLTNLEVVQRWHQLYQGPYSQRNSNAVSNYSTHSKPC